MFHKPSPGTYRLHQRRMLQLQGIHLCMEQIVAPNTTSWVASDSVRTIVLTYLLF
jgi:hypothetical protein